MLLARHISSNTLHAPVQTHAHICPWVTPYRFSSACEVVEAIILLVKIQKILFLMFLLSQIILSLPQEKLNRPWAKHSQPKKSHAHKLQVAICNQWTMLLNLSQRSLRFYMTGDEDMTSTLVALTRPIPWQIPCRNFLSQLQAFFSTMRPLLASHSG